MGERTLKRATITGLCVLLMGLVCTPWYIRADQVITVSGNHSMAWVIPIENISDLFHTDQIDLIIEATVSSKSVSKAIKDQINGIELNRMFTEVEVHRILKQNEPISADEYKNLTIIEPTYVLDYGFFPPGKEEYPVADYRKAKAGSRYIFFLSWSEKEQHYWVAAAHQGKYNVDGTDAREDEITTRNEAYSSLKQQVLSQFK